MTLWFQSPTADVDDIVYAIKRTELRDNAQFAVSQIEKRRGHNFFLVLHDGEDEAYYIPYSWFREKVELRAPTYHRPESPKSRFYITYPTKTPDEFSWGKKEVVVTNLAAFRDLVSSEGEARKYLADNPIPGWVDVPEGVAAIAEDWLAGPAKSRLPKKGSGKSVKLAEGSQKYIIHTTSGEIVEVNEDKGGAKPVVEIYNALIASGKLTGKLAVSKAKTRPFQRALRIAALDLYRKRCAMCDVDVENQLVASHIVGVRDATDAERTSLQNVILLCRLHDGLFDKHLVTVDETGVIHAAPALKSKSNLLKEWAFGIDGHKLAQPAKYKPDKTLLKRHAKASGWA